jgi:hypothetical protein
MLRSRLFPREKTPKSNANKISQAAPATQFQAERFLPPMQGHGLVQTAPSLQDQGLVAA